MLSLISLVELEGGVHSTSQRPSNRRARLEAWLETVKLLPFDRAVVARYGELVAEIGFARSRLLDRLIAATALVHDLTLVTANGPDFSDIPGLKLEVWPRPAQ